MALHEALIALLENAAVHGHRPEEPAAIVLRSWREGSQLFLQVEDRGPGVDGLIERLFQPFYTSRLADSSGLGLTLVHSVVTTLFQGTVDIVTGPDQGFLIRCAFPLS